MMFEAQIYNPYDGGEPESEREGKETTSAWLSPHSTKLFRLNDAVVYIKFKGLPETHDSLQILLVSVTIIVIANAFGSSSDMQPSRWRNLLSIKSYMIQSASASSTHFSAFHSTPCSCEKWKSKWNSEIKRSGQQPRKSHIKFVTRQKRADAKKALKSLLYNSGSSKFSFEDKETKWNSNWHGDQDDRSNSYSSKGQPRSGHRFGGKSQKKTKQKIRRESFFEDVDGHPEQIFQAKFGNKWYTWTYSNLRGSSSESSTSGFEWREHPNRTNKWKSASDIESDDDSCCVGLSSDRTTLGLPPTGPLKIEDVKNAFRLSALKWHPDKHQGPSQAMAEEKFKLCVNAYKSLCNALAVA